MNKKIRSMVENLVIFIGVVVIIYSIYGMFNTSSSESAMEGDIDLINLYNKLNSIDFEDDMDNTVALVSPPKTQITLARTKSAKIEEIDIESYIEGVVAAEVPNSFEIEALKAQAVAARGLTFSRISNTSKHKNYNNADLCDDYSCCQAYNPSNINAAIKKAVEETKGVVPILAGNYAQTLYFASTLEGTLTDRDVWGNKTESTVMYKSLSGPSPESKIISGKNNQYPYATDTTTIGVSEFIKVANVVYPNNNLTESNIKDKLKIISRTNGGYVDKVQLGDVTITGSDLRHKLVKDLKSANFTIEFKGSTVLFISKGFGHGVGMSQWGANALAKEGFNYKDILNYYFNDLELEQLY